MALQLLGSAASGSTDAMPLGFRAYSEAALSGSLTLVSGNPSAQTTDYNAVITGTGHTISSSGITVPAGRYLCCAEVEWLAAQNFGDRYPCIYDGTTYHTKGTAILANFGPGSVQTYMCRLYLTGSTLLQLAFADAQFNQNKNSSSSTRTKLMVLQIG
jgi:hypothetical protein